MSYLTEFETACPHCQHPNDVEVWSSVNVKADPELREILLGGELNMVECVSCREVFYAEHFILYHDPSTELTAFVYPHSYAMESSEWEKKTEADFATAQSNSGPEEKLNYGPVSLFGLDALVSLVAQEEEAAIQGEIISLLAKDNGFQVRTLRPSDARRRKLPPVLPYIDDSALSKRDALMAALARIRAINDRLSVYSELESRLLADPVMNVRA